MHQTSSFDQQNEGSQHVLAVDFHDFIHMAVWMDDAELAEAFHIGRREAEVLRRKLARC